MIVRKPPMGWNSWNTFGANINEKVVMETADAIVEKGLKAAGYEYVVIDDCWSLPKRDENGMIVADPVKFPHGMKYVADYVHSKGLKFGMYSCDGSHTCAGYPGSFDHEFTDARMFADIGVDFLKYDNCWKPQCIPVKLLYNRMSMALKATGRDILFSACNWGSEEVHHWIRSTGAHMFRSTGDIYDNFVSARDIAISQLDKLEYSGNNCFNDLDMLICGIKGTGNVGIQGCTPEEYALHFALWCLMGSPLMLGVDVRTIDDETLSLVTNPQLIALDQDEEARPPMVIHNNSQKAFTFFRHLENGEYAVGYFNMDDEARHMRFETYDVGLGVNGGYDFEFTDMMTGNVIKHVREYENFWLEARTFKLFRAKLVPAEVPARG